MYKLRSTLAGIMLTIMVIAACGAGEEQPAVQTQGVDLPALGNAPDAAMDAQGMVPGNEAFIETVDVIIMESFPVQINAVIRGYLPNTCVAIDQVNQTYDSNTFVVAVDTMRETGTMCAEQKQPFEETASLDVVGLTAGTYTVTVTGANHASNTFALAVDNVPPQMPPTPELMGASITGIVWDDTCRLLADGSPSVTCVEEGGVYGADGLFSNGEPRIFGVEVLLKADNCPGSDEAIGFSTTDAGGTYLFTSLRANTYCVVIDSASETNMATLSSGQWTYPNNDTGSITVLLGENGYQTVDFGWEYQADVAPTPAPVQNEQCNDVAAFVADVTVPDDTVLASDEQFIKTWRVKNEGDCTWGPGYSLAFNGGNQMGAPENIPITQIIEPGDEAEISITLTAPAGVGTHRGDWMLQNLGGNLFGSRGDYPFYVQIVIETE